MSRLENAPSLSEVGRLTGALVDIFCRSFPSPPAAITLDIDETCDAVALFENDCQAALGPTSAIQKLFDQLAWSCVFLHRAPSCLPEYPLSRKTCAKLQTDQFRLVLHYA